MDDTKQNYFFVKESSFILDSLEFELRGLELRYSGLIINNCLKDKVQTL